MLDGRTIAGGPSSSRKGSTMSKMANKFSPEVRDLGTYQSPSWRQESWPK